MKKVLIIFMSCWFINPCLGTDDHREDRFMPVKPRAQKSGVYFKVRRVILKGPKAKNQRIWKDRSVRKPLPTRPLNRKRKGAKGLARIRS